MYVHCRINVKQTYMYVYLHTFQLLYIKSQTIHTAALHLQGAGDGGWSQRHDGNYLTSNEI